MARPLLMNTSTGRLPQLRLGPTSGGKDLPSNEELVDIRALGSTTPNLLFTIQRLVELLSSHSCQGSPFFNFERREINTSPRHIRTFGYGIDQVQKMGQCQRSPSCRSRTHPFQYPLSSCRC